ncbi:MAG: hypothetical protein ACTHJW_06530 [Streptosporangiaceae bacterium]
MGRKAHLVGSIPGANATEAMEAALSRLAPYLLTLSDGETGQRAWWIGACIANMGGNPDVELSGGGQYDFSSYDDVPRYRLREGVALSAENLEACLPYEQAFTSSFPLFRDLREKYARPDLPFQVGIPGALDLSVDAFGFDVGFDPRYYQPSFEATASQVKKIAAAGGSDVVFQLETPAALIAVAMGDDAAAKPTAQQVAALTVQLPAAVPAGTRFGVHLCLGDLNHKSMVGMRDITPAVLVANEVAAAWPADRPLEFIHVPFAAAEEPPSFDPAFYAPLSDLSIPSSVRFVAGCIHESLSSDKQVELLRMIESHLGREVDVAAACGLSRRPDVSQAWDAMEKALLLVETTPT